jgi:multiple sugar transport system permease protein
MSAADMSAVGATVPALVEAPGTTAEPPRARRGRWPYTLALLVITLVVLIPVIVTVVLSFTPQLSSTSHSVFTLENFTYIFQQTQVLTWLRNSLIATSATVVVAVIVAAPAGYVLSRSRSRAISGYALILFIAQSFPQIVSIVPLFVLFAKFNLNDNLFGLAIVYVSITISVATWMMAAYIDTIPVALEEAAWIDGCSLFGGFVKIVLRNSLPGILSTAIFAFLLAWSDFLIAVVFLRSSGNYTLPIGLQTFFSENNTEWGYVMAVSVVVLVPPVIVFGFLHRHFSVGGIGGALAGH